MVNELPGPPPIPPPNTYTREYLQNLLAQKGAVLVDGVARQVGLVHGVALVRRGRRVLLQERQHLQPYNPSCSGHFLHRLSAEVLPHAWELALQLGGKSCCK